MAATGSAVPHRASIGVGSAARGGLVARVVPGVALVASAISTIALALFLTRVFGPLWPALPTYWTVRNTGDERVIAAGHVEAVFRLLTRGADDEIPRRELPPIAGIQVDGGTIVLTFDGYPQGRLTIRTADSPGDAFLRTGAIAAAWSGGDLPDPIRRYVSVIAQSPVWDGIWAPPGQRDPARPQRPRARESGAPEHAPVDELRANEHPLVKQSGSRQARIGERSVWGLVLWSLIAGNVVAASLLAAGWRQSAPRGDSRRAAAGTPRTPRLGPLAAATALMALSAAVVAVAHFHFRMDDYWYLALATHYPTEMTGEQRLLSTRVHYQIGVLLGGGEFWFAASNLALLGALCTGWGVLLYRLGFSRDAAVIAAALLGLGPGTVYLLRQANGIEHLGATACLMSVLLLVDLAAREVERPAAWRWGVLVLALCLSVQSVLMKTFLMIVLPPSCWLWGRWLVERPAPPMNRSITYVGFFAAAGGAMFALTRADPSLGFLTSREALAAVGDRSARYAVAALVLLALGAIRSGVRAGSVGAAATAPLVSIAGVLRSRAGRLPLPVAAVVLSAIWVVPFVLNAEYEGQAHYGLLASAPLSAVAAWLIASAADQWGTRGWRGFAAAALAVVILLPLADIRAELRRGAAEFVPVWLDDVRALTAARPQPERIVVVPACDPSTFDAPLSRQMTEVYSETGIWWATGWYDVPIEFRDHGSPPAGAAGAAANVVTLGYCPGRPATIR